MPGLCSVEVDLRGGIILDFGWRNTSTEVISGITPIESAISMSLEKLLARKKVHKRIYRQRYIVLEEKES
jgi:hypothetical protein